MPIRLEIGPVVNYGKGLIEKTAGIHAADKVIEAQGTIDGFGNGLLAMALSYFVPATMRGITSELHSEFRGTMKAFGGGLIDIGVMTFLGLNSQSIPEFFALKITLANLGTHMMVDAIRGGLDIISNLKPPTSVTLVV